MKDVIFGIGLGVLALYCYQASCRRKRALQQKRERDHQLHINRLRYIFAMNPSSN